LIASLEGTFAFAEDFSDIGALNPRHLGLNDSRWNGTFEVTACEVRRILVRPKRDLRGGIEPTRGKANLTRRWFGLFGYDKRAPRVESNCPSFGAWRCGIGS